MKARKISNKLHTKLFNKQARKTKKVNKISHYKRGGIRL